MGGDVINDIIGVVVSGAAMTKNLLLSHPSDKNMKDHYLIKICKVSVYHNSRGLLTPIIQSKTFHYCLQRSYSHY